MAADPMLTRSFASHRARPDVDLAAAVRDWAARRPSALPDRLAVYVPANLRVAADGNTLDALLDALTSNAERFAPPGSPIHVTAISDEEGQVEISVRDAGPGLGPDQRRVLETGARAARRGGLVRARRIVDLHGGRMRAERGPEGGACVSFTLPRPAPPGDAQLFESSSEA